MISQKLNQKQQLKILPRQIELLNLFHLTTLELDRRIEQELEENPVLEEVKKEEEPLTKKEEKHDFSSWEEYGYDDIPDYKQEYSSYFSSVQLPEKPIQDEATFRDGMKEQLQWLNLSKEDYDLANFIIASLNDTGILDQSLDTIAEDYSFQENKWVDAAQVESVLKQIQRLEPAGVGARTMQESFLLQLERMDKENEDLQMAIQIIQHDYKELSNGEISKIVANRNISHDTLKRILELIAGLQFRPVNQVTASDEAKEVIVPDFIVAVEEDIISVGLARQRSDSLHINHAWISSMKSLCNKPDRVANQYLKSKLERAEWFLSAVNQREATMLKIMEAIVNWQREYFLTGDHLLLRPMILKNISDETGMDISTISRVTTNKYASTPFGNILLKNLFSEGLKDLKGEVVNSRVIQKALKDIIETENKSKPFTDHELADRLSMIGFKLARRTVAKYREVLRIPSAQWRAIWA